KPLSRLARADGGATPSNQTGIADCKCRSPAGAWRLVSGRADSQSHSGRCESASDPRRRRNSIGAYRSDAVRACESPSEARGLSIDAGFSPPMGACRGPAHSNLGIGADLPALLVTAGRGLDVLATTSPTDAVESRRATSSAPVAANASLSPILASGIPLLEGRGAGGADSPGTDATVFAPLTPIENRGLRNRRDRITSLNRGRGSRNIRAPVPLS